MRFIKKRFLFLENKKQAEKILNMSNSSVEDEDYILLKNTCMEMFNSLSFLGLMVKFRYQQDISIQELLDLLKWLKVSNRPKNKLSQDPLKFDKFEDIKDEIINIDNSKKVNSFIREMNSLQKGLLKKSNRSTLTSFKNWAIQIFEHKNKKNLFVKLSKSKTIEEVIESMKDFIYKNTDTPTYNKKLSQINDIGAELVYSDEDKGILVARIDYYEQSNKLGSSSWCISTGFTTFKSYVTDIDNTQFFIWNFNYDISKPYFMTGLTYRMDMTLRNAHDMNDKNIKSNLPSFVKDVVKLLSPIDEDDLLKRKIETESLTYDKTKSEGIEIFDKKKEGERVYSSYEDIYNSFKKIEGIRPEDTELLEYLDLSKRETGIELVDDIRKKKNDYEKSNHKWLNDLIKIILIIKKINLLDLDDLEELTGFNTDKEMKSTLIKHRDLSLQKCSMGHYKEDYSYLISTLSEILYKGDMEEEINQRITELENEYILYKEEWLNEGGPLGEQYQLLLQHLGVEDDKSLFDFNESDKYYRFNTITYNGDDVDGEYYIATTEDADGSLYDYHESLIDEGSFGNDIPNSCINTYNLLVEDDYDYDYFLEEIKELIESDYDVVIDDDVDVDIEDRLSSLENLKENSDMVSIVDNEEDVIDGMYNGMKVYKLLDEDGDNILFTLSDFDDYVENKASSDSKERADEINDEIENDPVQYIKYHFGEGSMASYIDTSALAQHYTDNSDGYYSFGMSDLTEVSVDGSNDYVIMKE